MTAHGSTWDQFASAAREFIEAANEGWSQAMRDTAEGLERLARHGWYMSASVGWDVPVELGRDKEADWSQIDSQMRDLWAEEPASAQGDLERSHPRRAPLLRQAFAAHQKKQYFLSVPVFLSQADGICVELHGVGPFSKDTKRGVMRLKDAVTADDRLTDAYLAPLVSIQPVAWGREDREAEPGHLNRHAVLHGEDVDYGTEVNSLKALSLLSYASWAVREAKRLDPSDGES